MRTRRLTLHRETVRHLSAAALARAAGGTVLEPTPPSERPYYLRPSVLEPCGEQIKRVCAAEYIEKIVIDPADLT